MSEPASSPAPPPSAEPPPPSASAPASADDKLKVQFKAVGGAPLLKKTKFQVKSSQSIAVISQFLRKTLRLQDADPLFVYVNSSFAPGLDQTLESLHACFKVNDELCNYKFIRLG